MTARYRAVCTEFPRRRFKLDKRSQLFISTRNKTFSIVAMCVSNEDGSPASFSVAKL